MDIEKSAFTTRAVRIRHDCESNDREDMFNKTVNEYIEKGWETSEISIEESIVTVTFKVTQKASL